MIKNQFKTLSDPIWNRNQHLKPIRSGSTCWTTLQHVWVPMWPFVSVWLSKLEINYFNHILVCNIISFLSKYLLTYVWYHFGMGLTKTSRQQEAGSISRISQCVRLVLRVLQSPWNLAGGLPDCQPNFKAIWISKHSIPRVPNLMRSCNKTTY